MSRNGAGIYTPVASPDFPAVAFTAIRSAAYNNQILDMAAALTASLTADGQKVPTANLPMGGKKHTGVANATTAAEYMALGQLSAAIAALTKLALGGTARVWEAGTVALDLGAASAISVDPAGNLVITNNLRFVAPDWLYVTTAPASMLILDKAAGSFKFLTAVSGTGGAAAAMVERGSLSNLGVLTISGAANINGTPLALLKTPVSTVIGYLLLSTNTNITAPAGATRLILKVQALLQSQNAVGQRSSVVQSYVDEFVTANEVHNFSAYEQVATPGSQFLASPSITMTVPVIGGFGKIKQTAGGTGTVEVTVVGHYL